MVWLRTVNLPLLSGVLRKLTAPWTGLYKVAWVTSPVAYRLKLPDSFGCLHNVFHASLLKPHHGAVPYHAEPIVVDAGAAAEPEFEFEALL